MSNKKIKIVFSVLVCFSILVGCGAKGLSDNYNEDEVRKKAEDVISYINDKDTDAILNISSAEMKEVLTKDTIKEVYGVVEDAGEFEKIADLSLKEKDDLSLFKS